MRSRNAVNGSAFRTVNGPLGLDTQQLIPLDCQLIPPAFCSAFGIPSDADVFKGGFRHPVGHVFRGQYPFWGQDASSANYRPYSVRPQAQAFSTQASGNQFGAAQLDWPYTQAPLQDPTATPPQQDGHVKKDAQLQVRNQPLALQPDSFRQPRTQALPEGHQRVLHIEEARDTDAAAPSGDALNSTKPLHRTRVVWSDELHQRFLSAIEVAGSLDAAVPTVILKLMNVSGLSRDNVASHLQKHRMGLKRGRSTKRRADSPARGNRTRRKNVAATTANTATVAINPLPAITVHPAVCHDPSPCGLSADAETAGDNPELKPGEGETQNADDEERGGSNREVSNRDASNDREGSNHGAGSNDREGSNDGPRSEDGGAGSDNGKNRNAVDAPLQQQPPSACDRPGKKGSHEEGSRPLGSSPPSWDKLPFHDMLHDAARKFDGAGDRGENAQGDGIGQSDPSSLAEKHGSNMRTDVGGGSGSGSGAGDAGSGGGDAGSGGDVGSDDPRGLGTVAQSCGVAGSGVTCGSANILAKDNQPPAQCTLEQAAPSVQAQAKQPSESARP